MSSPRSGSVVRLAPVALPAVLVWAASVAGPGSVLAQAAQARDSAGIQIVESSAPALPAARAWSVDSVPLVQIGAMEGGDQAYLLDRTRQVRRFPDGGFVLVQERTRQIRVYDASGTHETTFGREGEGPGEFSLAPLLASPTSDTLVAWDARARRLSWFLRDGTLVRDQSFATEATEARLPAPTNPFGSALRSDGVLVTRGENRGRAGDDGIAQSTFTPFVADVPGGTVRSTDPLPSSRTVAVAGPEDMNVTIPDIYGPSGTSALGPSDTPLLTGHPSTWEIRYLTTEGTERRIARAAVPTVMITDEAWEEARASQIRGWDGVVDAAVIRRAFDRLPRSETLPPVAALHTDRAGNVWVGRPSRIGFDDPRTFDVLDPDGRWLTTVVLPRNITSIEEVGDDYLVTIWRDDLGVEYVRAHRLRKPG